MNVEYCLNGEIGSTSNVYVDWPDGICYLVLNQWGVVGAVIVMPGGPDDGWHDAYEGAVDEIAHDVDEDRFDEEEITNMIEDGQAQYRGCGVPGRPNRTSHIADTEYLQVFRCPSPVRNELRKEALNYSLASHGR